MTTEHTVDIAIFAAISFLALVADGGARRVVWNGIARRRFSGLAGFIAGKVGGGKGSGKQALAVGRVAADGALG